MVRTFPIGDQILAQATFLNKMTGLPQNPTNVTCRLRDPNGQITTQPNVTNPSPGIYLTTFIPLVPGNWYLRWEGTGAVVGAIESVFEVRPTMFPNPQ